MAERSGASDRDELFEAIRSLGATFDADEQRAVRGVYQQLLAGTPVTVEAITDAVGWGRRRARRFLDELPQAERDEEGRVVGFGGMTLRRTAHRVVAGEAVAHAWCAWDALFLPVVLQVDVRVDSTCPTTGRRIRLTVSPTGVTRRDPESTVLSFVRPSEGDDSDVRGNFCAMIHFFADDHAARTFTADAPGTLVLGLDEAFNLGRRCIIDRSGGQP